VSNYFINDTIERVINEGGYSFGKIKIPILGYCDDEVLLSRSINKLEKMIDMLCLQYNIIE